MAENSDPIVITGMARTAMGGFQGELAPLTAPQLGAAAIGAALSRAGVAAEDLDEVIMGCVLPAGQGQAPARQAQDAFAIRSLKRAQGASADGTAAREIVAVTVKTRKAEASVDSDEQPRTADLDKIPKLRPAFREGGTVTAANSSSISDGAAALVLMKRSEAERRGLAPLAVIRGHATHAQAPAKFTTAPIGAIGKVLDKVGWSTGEVELYEINEAFAVVTMAAMRDLDLPADKVNPHGGACALGHPVGASGARILVTLLNALEKYGLNKGVAALCIGGGEATAVAVERIQ